MANQRFNEAPGGALATLLAADFIPIMKQSNSTDYYVTPAVIANYIETGLTMTGTLACGANTLSGSAVAFTGGTIDGIVIGGSTIAEASFSTIRATALGANIDCQNYNMTNVDIDSGAIDGVTMGANSAILSIQIDNILINGNTIAGTGAITLSTTSNSDINLTPNGTGVVSISTSLECTSGITAVTATFTGDTAIAGNLYLNGSTQTITGTGTALAAQTRTLLRTGAGAATITMTDGVEDGQMHYITMNSDGGGDATLSGGKLGFTSMVFKNEGNSCQLQWNEADDLWYCVGTTGGTFNE